MDFVREPERRTPLVLKTDVVVVGGGPAGVGAALSAARNGAKAVVIERFGALGGIPVVGFMFNTSRGKGVCREIYDKLEKLGYAAYSKQLHPGYIDNPLTHTSLHKTWGDHPLYDDKRDELSMFNSEMCQWVLNEMMEEAGVTMMLDTLFVDVLTADGTLKAVIVENTSGRQAIEGKIFIDATNVAGLAVRAGVPYVEPKDENGLLEEVMGLLCKACGVDYDRLLEYQQEDPLLDKKITEATARGELPYYSPKVGPHTGHPRLEMMKGLFPGEMLLWICVPYEWNLRGEKIDDLIRAEIFTRKLAVSEMTFLKKNVPGFEKAYLSGFSPYMGIRESRHPVGEYVYTPEDRGRKFEDVVYMRRGQQLPYRCFLPKKIENMLLAGHCLSTTYRGGTFGSFPGAVYTGQVAGTAAALTLKNAVSVKSLPYSILKNALVGQGLLMEAGIHSWA